MNVFCRCFWVCVCAECLWRRPHSARFFALQALFSLQGKLKKKCSDGEWILKITCNFSSIKSLFDLDFLIGFLTKKLKPLKTFQFFGGKFNFFKLLHDCTYSVTYEANSKLYSTLKCYSEQLPSKDPKRPHTKSSTPPRKSREMPQEIVLEGVTNIVRRII